MGDASIGTASFNLTVTDDVIVEPDETVTVSGTTAAAGFGTIPPVTLTITDDDIAPDTITLSLSPSSVREARGSRTEATTITVTASFPEGGTTLLADTVVMVSVAGGAANPATTEGEDFATVTDFPVTIAEGSISGSATFDLVQTGDRFVEGDETLTVSGSAGSLGVMPATLTITDNDNPPTAITLSLSPVSVSEGDVGTTTTEVRVTAEIPRGGGRLLTDIEVPISVAGGGGNPATDGGTDFATVTGFTVTIPTGGFSGTNTFDLVVTGDTLAEGDETLTVSATAATTFAPIDPQTLTITDESTDTDTDTGTDTAGVTITPTTLAVTEGGEQTYTVVLDTAPAGAVTVAVTLGSGAAAPITVTPLSLSFDSTTWSTAQTVTVTANQDDDALGGTRTLTHTVSDYPGVPSAADVLVTVNDNDTAGVTITPTTLAVAEGGEQTYTVKLDTAPAGAVTVAVTLDSGTAPPITFSPASLSFDSTTWSTAQTVTVTATEDDDALDGTRTLTHTVSDYPGVPSAADVLVTVNDNDTAGVTITPTTLTVAEGGEQTYTVKLDTEPAGAVTVAVDPGSGATAPITVSELSLSFDSTTWSTAQTVTVTATEDDDALGGTRTLTHTVSDYPGVPSAADVLVTVNDNDTAGVTITPTTLTVTEGGEQTYTVKLNTEPAGTVVVAIDSGSGATAPITVTPLSLSFDSTTWSTAQTVTVTAEPEDDDALGGMRTLAHAVTNYPTVTSAADVVVTVSDDDTAGVTISETEPGDHRGRKRRRVMTVVLDTDAGHGPWRSRLLPDVSGTALHRSRLPRVRVPRLPWISRFDFDHLVYCLKPSR